MGLPSWMWSAAPGIQIAEKSETTPLLRFTISSAPTAMWSSAPWPGSRTRYTVAEMDQHVKMAIRFVKEHAQEYQIDADRIGIMGASAGGHLATLAALTPEEAAPNAKKTLDRHDTTVGAVGVFFPPTDFLDWGGKMADKRFLGPLLSLNGIEGLDEQAIEAAARKISPLHRVGKPTIPFLLIHGDADPVVPLSQSRSWSKRLTTRTALPSWLSSQEAGIPG